MRFYLDLAIHVLSIFLSCMLLLIHIFMYVPIIHVHVLIPEEFEGKNSRGIQTHFLFL